MISSGEAKVLGRAGPSVVAVKTLKENAGERERLDLLQELQVMKSLEPHPHVVRLLGCCTEKGTESLKENAGERERLDLLQELQVMKSLEPHPHVVRLLGCCTEKGTE
ncbi:hypothetical protein LSTR_LSTR016359 [Laodelphax striatellus]|uniref:Serine-threonine/tyrosine-protein kinase catalytic domain-containing protein n=1 Tax=Laodelphax striatellus TaxID=195883 RepID=A0A482X3D7_LAOST|nr:hypothetical protein LSTR_LSTR016359 [Laodelphax striatellus]